MILAAKEFYEAGPTGLFVIILLGIGVYFLGRSMVKHIRRVPASFDGPDQLAGPRAADPRHDGPPLGDPAGPHPHGDAETP